MAKLSNKVVLVAGRAGEVGKGIIKCFLRENATVMVPSRSEEKLQHLKGYCRDVTTGTLQTIQQNVGNLSGATHILTQIQKEFGKLDVVVASLGGGWPSKPVLQIPLDDWQKAFQDYLLSHLVLAKAFMPYLLNGKSGHYIMINGVASEQVIKGWVPVSMMTAAQLILSKGLALDNKSKGVQVNTVSLFSPVSTRERGEHIRPEWLTAEEVGEYLVNIISEAATKAGEVVHRLYPHATP